MSPTSAAVLGEVVVPLLSVRFGGLDNDLVDGSRPVSRFDRVVEAKAVECFLFWVASRFILSGDCVLEESFRAWSDFVNLDVPREPLAPRGCSGVIEVVTVGDRGLPRMELLASGSWGALRLVIAFLPGVPPMAPPLLSFSDAIGRVFVERAVSWPRWQKFVHAGKSSWAGDVGRPHRLCDVSGVERSVAGS
jgi:hypothetical protein